MHRINKIVCFLSLLVFTGGGLYGQGTYIKEAHPTASTRNANENAPVITRDGIVFCSDKGFVLLLILFV